MITGGVLLALRVVNIQFVFDAVVADLTTIAKVIVVPINWLCLYATLWIVWGLKVILQPIIPRELGTESNKLQPSLPHRWRRWLDLWTEAKVNS